MTSAGMRAFVDESSCVRTDTTQEYLIGAAIVTAGDCDEIREALRHLRLPGQIKPHWTDESDRRRRTITETIADLGSMHVWQIGPVGTPSPAIRYFDSGDSVLLGAGGVVCSG